MNQQDSVNPINSNPLFQDAPKPVRKPTVAPPPQSVSRVNPAITLVRRKLAALYNKEPDAYTEAREAAVAKPPSKHQEFMLKLNSSGKTLAEIQTEWHNYYLSLPDHEKHEVWQEFYETNAKLSQYHKYTEQHPVQPDHSQDFRNGATEHIRLEPVMPPSAYRSPSFVRRELISRVTSRAATEAKNGLKSLGFGLGIGVIVILIFLFGFFNQVIIAPFIQPSRHVGNTPLIITTTSASSLGSTPQVIIPKINVEIPVDYSLTTDDESVIETALENGVVHYPSTVMPGQDGNAAFFGHSSNNIFNPGKYKFAFVLLHTLVKGDTFYLTYNGTIYVYQVIDTRIVPPSDVSVLNDTEGKTATATLITCDPPGTSINRLVVTGEQISPSPTSNSSAPAQTISQPTQLASNGPSLWSRFWHWLF